MSPWALWLCVILLIGSGVASDVPFVFDETTTSVASYNSDQIEQAHILSPDLAGVPIVYSPPDSEILAFPVTGGGSTLEGTTDKKVGELKDSLSARVEPDNSVVRHEAVVLAAKYPGDRTIDQISSIYNYLKNGADSKNGWSYVADTRGIDNFMYANETLEIGKEAGCVGAGDCDDFAILMSALVESVGGTTRIILARNNTTGGHAYTEVYLGRINETNNQVEDIISWLKEKFDTDKIYTHIDTDTKDVWLNLDWGPDEKGNMHPGGPFYQGDKHIVLCIRDKYGKTPLKMPEISNKPVPSSAPETDLSAKKDLQRSKDIASLLVPFDGISGMEIILDISPYSTEYIPGAISIPYTKFLGQGSILKPVSEMAAVLGKAGISQDDAVLIYGECQPCGGGPSAATYVYWIMLYLGHKNVKLLDGGIDDWMAAQRPTVTQPASLPSQSYTPAIKANLLATYEFVHSGTPQIIDARTAPEYEAGSIPGSVNIPYDRVLDGKRIKDKEELKDLFSSLDKNRSVVVYTNTGLKASMIWLALTLLDYDARIYTWQDWAEHQP
ncbi:MAG: rhodanese-like domain-containing protein [Methanothrix sp.]